jgi:hypothetical protein
MSDNGVPNTTTLLQSRAGAGPALRFVRSPWTPARGEKGRTTRKAGIR